MAQEVIIMSKIKNILDKVINNNFSEPPVRTVEVLQFIKLTTH